MVNDNEDNNVHRNEESSNNYGEGLNTVLSSHSNTDLHENNDHAKSSLDNNNGPDADPSFSSSSSTFSSYETSNNKHSPNPFFLKRCNMSTNKPNKLLSKEEKEEKRKLQKILKIQNKIQKLQTRIKHAKSRNDPIVEQQAKDELQQYINQHRNYVHVIDNELLHSHDEIVNNGTIDENNSHSINNGNDYTMNHINISSATEETTKKWIISMANELFKFSAFDNNADDLNNYNHNSTNNHDDTTNKHHQTKKGVELLKHMTKGTQEKYMFQDSSALWGYTRQKFYERAMLLFNSLFKLSTPSSTTTTTATTSTTITQSCPNTTLISSFTNSACTNNHYIDLERIEIRKQEKMKENIWNRMKHGSIKSACSIGCGPGNDALGLLSFLRMIVASSSSSSLLDDDDFYSKSNMKGNYEKHQYSVTSSPHQNDSCKEGERILEKLILLDWTIQEWDEAVLCHLKSLLYGKCLVDSVQTGFCDVTKSLLTDECNHDARRLLIETMDENTAEVKVINAHTDHNRISNCDVYLVSYLISETRNKWEVFFAELFAISKQFSIFYFAEPTPWQLHTICDKYRKNDLLDILWLDSSMLRPSMQCLDRRLGPAVLIAMKK